MASHSLEMTREGFLHRLFSGGYFAIFKGFDLYAALVIIGLVYYFLRADIGLINPPSLIQNITFFAQSLLAVIIVGVSILVTITKVEFLKILIEDGVLDKLFYVFEFTAMLALLTAAAGITLQAIGYNAATFYLFLFLGIYLLFAVARLISVIVSFGRRRAMIAVISDLPDDLGDQLMDEKQDSESE